jgi:RNA polymerase sigma factor (sigma-70 family)
VTKRHAATRRDLERLYRQRFAAFARVATAISGDPERGKDAVQAAFVAAVRGVDSFRGVATLEGWVWRILVREARRLVPRVESSLEEVSAEGQTNGSLDGSMAEIRTFIAALPPRQREAVFLRYFADLDYRTIARVLGIETGTVSATLNAAHQSLRERLEASAR